MIKRRIFIVLLEAILIIFFLYFLLFFVLDYLKIPCVINEFTGIYCPGCGITRAIKCLLVFDIRGVFNNNSLLFLLILFFGYYLYKFLKNYIKKGNLLSITDVYSNRVIYSLLVICLLFGILRNFPWFSFLAPVSFH